jgi:hypothetical protein
LIESTPCFTDWKRSFLPNLWNPVWPSKTPGVKLWRCRCRYAKILMFLSPRFCIGEIEHLLTCLQFLHTFIGMLFDGKPGRWRIDARQYALIGTETRRRINSPEAINSGDQLTMSMVLLELASDGEHCPFPSCRATLPKIVDQGAKAQIW